MWNQIESLTAKAKDVSFLDLQNISNALVIYESRRRLGAAANGPYDNTRDRNALMLGVRLLETPTDPAKRYRHNVVMGNIVDWSEKPARMPRDKYIAQIAEDALGTVNAVLNKGEVNPDKLKLTKGLFGRWTDQLRSQPPSPKPLSEKELNPLLERLAACRNVIDAADEKIIDQAISRGFDIVLAEVEDAVDPATTEDAADTDSEVVIAIAERRSVAPEIAEIKLTLGTGTTDRLREQEMKEKRYEWAGQGNLTKKEVDKLIDILKEDSKRVQEETRKSLLAKQST